MLGNILLYYINKKCFMNIVGIDPSLLSTGITINGKVFNFVRESDVYGKTKMNKWYAIGSEKINYNFITHHPQTNTYAQNEIIKMIDYDKITTDIVELIKKEIRKDEHTRIGIESYSYNSKNGDIIDLVTFSTTLRIKLYQQITHDLVIIPPASLKLEAAKMTYVPKIKGKKVTYRNKEGIAGGHFQKREMFLSLIENENNHDEYVEFLRSVSSDCLETGKINKPFDDCNDSYILFKILESNI